MTKQSKTTKLSETTKQSETIKIDNWPVTTRQSIPKLPFMAPRNAAL
jgi:hypothetical protein